MTSPADADIDRALHVLRDHAARVLAVARAVGRETRTLIDPSMICRETEAEA